MKLTLFTWGLIIIILGISRPNESTVRKFSSQIDNMDFSEPNRIKNSYTNRREGDINTVISSNSNSTTKKSLSKIVVLYDSSDVDREYQQELLKSVFIALRDLDEDDLEPQFIDLKNIKSEEGMPYLAKSANWIFHNGTTVMISLLSSDVLLDFSKFYDQLRNQMKIKSNTKRKPLKIITPRVVKGNIYTKSVHVLSMQMSNTAQSIALLNRVEKVGIRTIVPVLDDDKQLEFLNYFVEAGYHRPNPILFSQPIFMDNPKDIETFKDILSTHTGFNTQKIKISNNLSNNSNSRASSMETSNVGVLLLAVRGSRSAMKIADEQSHIQVGWFSPNILQHEEWAYNSPLSAGKSENQFEESKKDLEKANSSMESTNDNDHIYNEKDQRNFDINSTKANFYGLYTINFVGAPGWDNPNRKRALREITTFTGASPRILSAILAYDAAWVASDYAKSRLRMPMNGLSGEIAFDSKGFRREGVYFGVSAVPDLSSPSVALLQPSTWILEDVITMIRTIEGQHLITDYDVAKSSLLAKTDLVALVNQSAENIGCSEHALDILTHDPFNQMSYTYLFKEENLPNHLLLPNHHGFGITFLCTHRTVSVNDTEEQATKKQRQEESCFKTTLQIACTPGAKFSDPIKCFRSKFRLRQKRSQNSQPQYQFPTYNRNSNRRQDTYSSNSWEVQNNKWSSPRDDSQSSNLYQAPPAPQYYAPPPSYAPPPTYAPPATQGYGYAVSRLDVSDEPSSTPAAAAPAPAPAATKLPELRQILKAAKPFVGSCVGSSTGCAMCVLVLGRLPLGAVPAACTGPCFVGTFGGCGALLGRVFSETTVICTELFKQGLIDLDTFIADAEFGRSMMIHSPITLKGYQILATPLVEIMKKSETVTHIVAYFAIPWAHHMKYLMGRSDEPNLLGNVVHIVGSPLCKIVGHLHNTFILSDYSFTLLLVLALIIVALLHALSNYKKFHLQSTKFLVFLNHHFFDVSKSKQQ